VYRNDKANENLSKELISGILRVLSHNEVTVWGAVIFDKTTALIPNSEFWGVICLVGRIIFQTLRKVETYMLGQQAQQLVYESLS